jgi:hypothetical protein
MEIDTEYFDLEFEGEVGLLKAYLDDMEAFLWSEITRLKAEIKDAIVLDEKLVNMEPRLSLPHHRAGQPEADIGEGYYDS